MHCSTFNASAIVAVIFFVCKFFEVKFLSLNETDEDEEDGKAKPFKDILRDTVIVYASVWIGGFILDQFHAELGGIKTRAPPMVFTDPPNF